MLKLTGGRKTQSHPRGEVPQRMRGAECHVTVVGDYDKVMRGEEGVVIEFHDKNLCHPLPPTRSVYLDELEPSQEARREIADIVNSPVKLIGIEGSEFLTSRGRFDVTRITFADGGKSPRFNDKVLAAIKEAIAKLFPLSI